MHKVPGGALALVLAAKKRSIEMEKKRAITKDSSKDERKVSMENVTT